VATVSVSAPATAVSVEARCAAVRTLLAGATWCLLDDLFAAATSRLEAVATFLALLEMLKRGEILVEPNATGVMVVTSTPGVVTGGPEGASTPAGTEAAAEPARDEGSGA
jgi:hypothetical protein